MDYLTSFANRTHSYLNAINQYEHVLDEEINTAIQMLNLQKNDVLLNTFAGGIPIEKYINKDLNIQYLAFDTHKDFITQNIKYFTYDNIPVKSQSVNKIICLASLHHLNTNERHVLYNEFNRILTKNGTLIIADVIQNSTQAKWLNIFVNKYNSNGHNGTFFTNNDSTLIKTSGFNNVNISFQNYNWNFENDDSAIDFCKLLFGLNLCNDNNLLLYNIKSYLQYNNNKIPWKLIYFQCTK
jgi:hypothetical protein